MKYKIEGVFPCPIYIAQRDTNFDESELEEVKSIIEAGMFDSDGGQGGNYVSDLSARRTNNSYVFDTGLQNIRKFCEQHIQIYVDEVLSAKKDLNFYITQSWINVIKPGGFHHLHTHSNSILSGIFYISTEEGDSFSVSDPNLKIKLMLQLGSEESNFNVWNSLSWTFPVNNNLLLLFPSWLNHEVQPNEKATKERISLPFNVFARGIFGEERGLTELHLQ